MSTWASLIDMQYDQGLRAGTFEGLRGTGKPLRLNDNPFEGEFRLAHHVLRSQGCTLPWIEERAELLGLIDSLRGWLQDATKQPQHSPDAAHMFEREARRLNTRIFAFNMRAPASLVQIAPLDIAWELKRALPEPQSVVQQTDPLPVVIPHTYAGLLRAYLLPQWRRVAVMSFLIIMSIVFSAINPQILRAFIDAARAGGSSASLANAALLFLGVVVVGQIVSAYASYTSADVGWVATNELRGDLLHHCLRLDPSFHKDHTPGELIERVEGDVTALAHFFSQFIVQVLGNSLLLIVILALLFAEDWRIGLAMSLFVVITGTLLRRLQGIAVPAIAAAREASATLTSFWEERLHAAEDLKPNGAVGYTLRQLDDLLSTILRRIRTDRLLFRTYIATWAIALSVGNGLAFAVGAWLYRQGVITLGTVYMIFAYTGLLATNLGRITDHVNELQRAAASIGRIGALARIRSALADGSSATLPSGALSVAFEHVSFRYAENGQQTINDLSFSLNPGDVLGVLGRTGSGKTTLGRLLFRFYDPQAGSIRINSIDLRECRLADLRSRIAMVTQNVQLFGGSVRDNLTLFDDTIRDGEILTVINELGLGSWLARLPDGLDSQLSAGGDLSAGEAQLLAFARAFLRDPGVVVLDEASAHLDPASERLLEKAVARLLRGRTAIIIAHRLATLRRADTILVLDDGRVAEYGPRAQLAADATSRYAQLVGAEHEEVGQ